MRRTELLQEIRKMRFEEAYAGWNAERLTQDEAGMIQCLRPGCCPTVDRDG